MQSAVAALLDSSRYALYAFLAPFVAYLFTLSPTVYNLDSAEMTTAAYTMGLMRATGYPLYLVLGKLFSLLPVGDVGYRLNLMSAFFGALTVALVYRIARSLVGHTGMALCAALSLGFSYYFWSQSVIAEVYTLHAALMAALLFLLLRWREERNQGAMNRASILLVAAAGLYGLSFGNHMATVLLAPGLVAFVLMVAGRGILRPRQLVPVVVAFLLGLSIYLYLPLRYLAAPAFNYAGHYDASGRFIAMDLTQPAALWTMMTGQSFQGEMFDYTLAELPRELAQFVYRLWGNFLSVGLPIGLVGLAALWRRDRSLSVMLVLMFLANAVFYIDYRVVDKETMFLPVYLVWSLWLAVGLETLYRWAIATTRQAQGAPLAALFALVVIAGVIINAPRVDVSQDRRARELAEMLMTRVEPNAIVIGWWASVPPMQYLQLVEGWRPDVLLINRWLIGYEDMVRLINEQGKTRPIYIVEPDSTLAGRVILLPSGGAYRVLPARQ
jgi:hypothetical protein